MTQLRYVVVEGPIGAGKSQLARRLADYWSGLNAAHPIEVVGEQLRDMMPWIKANKLVDQSKN